MHDTETDNATAWLAWWKKKRALYVPLASIYNILGVFNNTEIIWGPKSYNKTFHFPRSQDIWNL